MPRWICVDRKRINGKIGKKGGEKRGNEGDKGGKMVICAFFEN